MPDGIALATAAPAVQMRAYDLAPTIFANTTGVLLTFGHPGAERADDIVFFGEWRNSEEPGPLSASNRSREEQVEFDIIFSSYRGGGWQAQIEAANRAKDLMQVFDLYVRQTNTELATTPGAGDGICGYCFYARGNSDSATVVDDAGIEVGRNVTITATYAAIVRIEGNS